MNLHALNSPFHERTSKSMHEFTSTQAQLSNSTHKLALVLKKLKELHLDEKRYNNNSS